MVESDPLGVMLRVRLGINLAFANFVDELGRNLNVMINQESEMMGRRLFHALHKDTSHRINVQVGRCTVRGWTNKGIHCVSGNLRNDLIQESKATEMHILRVLPTIEIRLGIESLATVT